MDFFDCHYYTLNKRLLSATGQWPYQNSKTRIVRTCVIFIIFCSFGVTQILKCFTAGSIVYFIIEILPQMLTMSTCSIKMFTHAFNINKMRIFLDYITKDWQTQRMQEEIKIMNKYAEESRSFTVFYITLVYASSFFFLAVPISYRLLDILAPLNESRPYKQFLEGEYMVDPSEYFYFIFCHTTIVALLGMTVLVAVDTMLMCYVQHICAIFAVLGYRLKYLLYERQLIMGISSVQDHRLITRNIILCVKTHRSAIRYVDLIESCYSWPLIIQLISNVITLSATLVKVISVFGNLEDALRYGAFAGAQVFHIFVSSYPGQKLIDHSKQISDTTYSGKWYDVPVETQKLLLFIIRRSLEPCCITAGKMYTLSLTSFTMVVQSCMSYFTVLTSMRFDH